MGDYWTYRQRDRMKSLWKDTNFKERMSIKFKSSWTPELRQLRSEMNIERWKSEEFRLKHAASLIKAQEELDYINKATEARKKPGHYETVSKSIKERYNREPEKRAEASAHAKRGWDAYTPEQRADRLHKSKLLGRYRAATNKSWVFHLTPLNCKCEETK